MIDRMGPGTFDGMGFRETGAYSCRLTKLPNINPGFQLTALVRIAHSSEDSGGLASSQGKVFQISATVLYVSTGDT
jgi:hypothetical protein